MSDGSGLGRGALAVLGRSRRAVSISKAAMTASVAVTGIFGCSAGGAETPPEPSNLTNAQELYGAGVTADMTSTSGYRAPVGQVFAALGCSGTAIADDTVLTAMHCMCNWSTGQWAPESSVSFSLPQAGGFTSPVGSYQVHPSPLADCRVAFPSGTIPLVGPPDLAVLKLSIPIPFNVVQDFPRVHLGSTKGDWDSGKLDSPAFVVGWGGTVTYDSSAGSGTRRFGSLWAEPAIDPCFGYPLEKQCNDYYQWEAFANAAVGAVAAKGDSGGPLFVKDTATGELILAGVYSGYYDPTPPGAANPMWVRGVWAPTGNIGSIGNHTFLIAALGGDTDKDGVPNAIDNCPADGNADQTDADGDGVGDLCDNCAPAVCSSLTPSLVVTCKNPSQKDWDGDGVGDTCDLCPQKDNSSSTQADDDGDGVGNDCDTCPQPNPYFVCTADSQCNAASKNAGFCVADPVGASLLFGRCSLVDDAEPDGIPDGCDACLNFTNASTLNSNDRAEERERGWNPSIAILADDCDPVPIVRVPKQQPTVMDAVSFGNLNTSDGTGPDEILDVVQERWLGKQTATEAPGSGLLEAWGYRGCSCFDELTGKALDLTECVGQGNQCLYAAPMVTPGWKIPTVTLTNGSSILNSNGVTVIQAAFYRGVAESMTLSWRWRDDLKTGKLTGQGVCGAAVTSCKAHIALFTTTQGAVASGRDASAGLRDVFKIIDAPAVMTYIPMPYTTLPSKCLQVPCLDWYNPKLYLLDPALQDFSEQFTEPVLLAKAGSSVAALTQASGAYDISGAVSPSVAALIGDTSRMWLTPTEPAFRVRQTPNRGGVQAVAFPRDFSPTTTVDVVLGTRSGLSGERRVDDGDVTVATALAAGPGGVSPRARTDVRAVLSGVEEAVYMVGGRAASGNASQAIWRYTIADRAWRIVAEHAGLAPSSHVIAVAYDEASAKLFVLDLDDEPHPGGKATARLTSYDVRAGTAVQLATWPYAALYEQLWLTATGEGSLLLVGAKKQVFKVWRLQPKPLGVKYTGTYTGTGQLLGQPTMGERHPVLAVGKGPASIEYRTLAPTDFAGPQPCSAL